MFGLAILVAATAAVASSAAPVVELPWGLWLTNFLAAITPAVGLVAVAVFWWAANKVIERLPPDLANIIQTALKQAQVDKVIGRGVDYSFAAVEGAARGQVVDVKVANQQITAAAQFVTKNAPQLATELGDTLNSKIVARLSAEGVVPKDAGAAALGHPLNGG